MTRENFWSGFAAGAVAGALAGIGSALVYKRSLLRLNRHIVRLEKSINIGRPVDVVFTAWSDVEHLPERISFVRRVDRTGLQSRWLVDLDGREYLWQAHVTQIVFNESIGWKSLSGPKHTGRISFSPLGNQTVVHVVMNYAPPMGEMTSLLPISERLEHWIERGLREFKSALERETTETMPLEKTGTSGPER